jgi:hypothetical protein
MNIKAWILRVGLGLAANAPAFAQGTFQNLDFELATIFPGQPAGSFVPATQAVPGWSVSIGGEAATTVLFNAMTIGSAGVSLLSTNGTATERSLEGTYGLLIQAGLTPDPGGGYQRTDVSVGQNGVVPEQAQTLLFKANQFFGPSRPFTVTLGETELALVSLTTTSTYTLYGADITGYGGQSVELRFTAYTPDGGLNNVNLDSITFSSQPIPEPNAAVLFLITGIFFCRAIHQQSKIC